MADAVSALPSTNKPGTSDGFIALSDFTTLTLEFTTPYFKFHLFTTSVNAKYYH